MMNERDRRRCYNMVAKQWKWSEPTIRVVRGTVMMYGSLMGVRTALEVIRLQVRLGKELPAIHLYPTTLFKDDPRTKIRLGG